MLNRFAKFAAVALVAGAALTGAAPAEARTVQKCDWTPYRNYSRSGFDCHDVIVRDDRHDRFDHRGGPGYGYYPPVVYRRPPPPPVIYRPAPRVVYVQPGYAYGPPPPAFNRTTYVFSYPFHD